MSSQVSSATNETTNRSKLWNWLSILLMIGGLALVATGIWQYGQQWLEASQPPPARIVEVSLADLEATPSPTSTPANPTATAPAITPTIAAKGETLPKVESATAPAPTATAPPEPTAPPADSTGSLAENPLPMMETAPTVAAEALPVSAEPARTDRPPLNRIVADSIKLDASIIDVGWEVVTQNNVPVNVWTVADYAAGWHKNSLLPGEGGNVVLSGHHNIKGEVFRYIVDLEPGANITLSDAAGQNYQYTVEDKFIVKDKDEPDAIRRANARWIGPFNDERLTLVTCWPYSNNTHRVIVIAKPVTP